MPEVTRYRHGVPNWVDVATPDIPAAVAFYEALFGWEAEDQGEQAGHYHMFRIDGLDVAGLGPATDPSAPPAWSTYISVDNVDAAAAAVAAHGGTVLFPPIDVMSAGRMTFVVDPTGAAVGLWQPGETIGSRLVNEPRTPVWHELATRDPEAAAAFYGAVVGWELRRMDDAATPYHLVYAHDRLVAGCIPMEGDAWSDVPAHWMVYFDVDDVDATAARVRDLGGSVVNEPFDISFGRIATFRDPTGPVFSVVSFSGGADDPNAGWPD